MKAKNLYYVMALCAGAAFGGATADAQDVFVEEVVTVDDVCAGKNNDRYYQSWRDNWFIELSAGGNQTIVERGIAATNEPVLSAKKWTATYSAGFGHWFSPYLAWRVKGVYGALHWDAPAWDKYEYGWSRMTHAGVHAELMWDMFNSCHGVNPKRVFSIVPFVGIGGEASWDFEDKFGNEPILSNILKHHYKNNHDFKRVQWTLPVSAGFQFRFRLARWVDFFAEARATMYGDNWNNYATGYPIDVLISAMGGFTFNINGRGWNNFNECNYVSQIAAMNDEINNLRGQLANCNAEVKKLQSMPPKKEYITKDCTNAPLMSSVRFTINSAKISAEEEVNVWNMYKWLVANEGEHVNVIGIADAGTGTPEINRNLSIRRANAVADALVKLGIDRNRLHLYSYGSCEQPYLDKGQNDWNRIVIFTQGKVETNDCVQAID